MRSAIRILQKPMRIGASQNLEAEYSVESNSGYSSTYSHRCPYNMFNDAFGVSSEVYLYIFNGVFGGRKSHQIEIYTVTVSSVDSFESGVDLKRHLESK